MKEEFVSYEQSVMLYNLDFDWETETAYFDNSRNKNHRLVHRTIAHKESIDYDGTDIYPAPTMALARKWLREVKDWHIIIEPNHAYGLERTKYSYKLYHRVRGYENWNHGYYYDSYESALSAGIDRCLTLLAEKK